MFPPTTLSPPPDSIPAVPVAMMPDLKVEVAPSPLILMTFWIVEEPAMIAEEEAFRRPLMWRLEARVEEAPDMNPFLRYHCKLSPKVEEAI